MKTSRHNGRTILLLLVEAMLVFRCLVIAVYARLGAVDAEDALIQRHGFYKAALATLFCLASFYILIKNQSLMLDATIMFETCKTILFGKGT